MRRRIGNLCMILGAVLVALALLLLVYNRWDAARAARQAGYTLTALQADLTEPKASPVYPTEGEMPTVTIDGYDYIGYILIPDLDISLPVQSAWSYPGLKIAPGRYAGSAYTGDLVIAGHNYEKHFGPLRWLDIGADVYLVDMNSLVWHYTVTAVETLEPTQIEEMTEKTTAGDWDLTLFTCTSSGQARHTVRCQRVL